MTALRLPSATALTALAGALAGVLAVTPARAQVALNTDLVVANAYVWRGVTFTNRPVLQPDAYLTAAAGGGAIVAGAALNVEPTAYRGAHDLSVLGAESGTLVTATSLWSEYTRSQGPVSATAGVVGYLYPRAAGIAASYNTVEAYAKGTLAAPLAPSLAVYYDVAQVRGAYLEAGLRQAVAAGSHVALAFAGVAGVSLGQEADAAGAETAYFSAQGLTHVDLSASATWSARGAAITPTVHALLGRDPATRLTAPGEQHRAKLLLGVGLGWATQLHH